MRVVLLTLILVLVAGVGVSEARVHDACANHLCTKHKPHTPKCWRFKPSGYQRVAKCFIRRAARHYHQSPRSAIATARCESRLKWWISGDFAGMYQFLYSTWSGTPYGRRGKSVYSPRWSSLGAMWMWRHGRRSEWPVCG